MVVENAPTADHVGGGDLLLAGQALVVWTDGRSCWSPEIDSVEETRPAACVT